MRQNISGFNVLREKKLLKGFEMKSFFRSCFKLIISLDDKEDLYKCRSLKTLKEQIIKTRRCQDNVYLI
jgi:hypothetical protein